MRGRQSAISSKRTILTNDPSFTLSCTHPSSRSVEWLPAKSAPGARSCLGVESTSLTLIKRRDRIVRPVQCNDATSRPASRTGAEPVVFTSAAEQFKSGASLPLFRSFAHSRDSPLFTEVCPGAIKSAYLIFYHFSGFLKYFFANRLYPFQRHLFKTYMLCGIG